MPKKNSCTVVMQKQTAYVLCADMCFFTCFCRSYLKYLAWALSDRETVVRLQAIKALTAMYSHRWVRVELHLCACACTFVWVVEAVWYSSRFGAVFVPVSVPLKQGVRGQALRLHLLQTLVPNPPLTRCCVLLPDMCTACLPADVSPVSAVTTCRACRSSRRASRPASVS